jgi:hypothetical protein
LQIVNGVGGDDHNLRGAMDRALQMVGSDVDLYVINLRRVAEQQGRMGQPILNFLGHVGAVQTGPYATATIVQEFGIDERQALIRSLEELRACIATVEAEATPTKTDVVEVIDEAHAEVRKERPNPLRLTSILSGIGTAVQTIAAAQPAYQMLKAAAATVGVLLP